MGKAKREYRGAICTKSQQSKKLESAFKTPTKGGAPQASRLIIADHLEKVKDCSKVVDENGEPLVVYHQTSNTFDSFDVRHEGLLAVYHTMRRLRCSTVRIGVVGWDIQRRLFSPREYDLEGERKRVPYR